MSALLRCASLRRVRVVLGFALMALVFAPSASGAAPLDTVTATGTVGIFSTININAQSGPAGQNPSGSASLTFTPVSPLPPFSVASYSGPVTCVSIAGPDRGNGTAGSQTTAVLNFVSYTHPSFVDVITVGLVDNGGNGMDLFILGPIGRAPSDCSTLPTSFVTERLNGRAVVFDAPLLPASRAQCKHGGWRNFGTMFKNQGQCVAFVVKQARQKCLTERAKIGLLAFRNKYGLGRYHVRALRRSINQASR
jgi:hypothetical protein